VKAALRSPQGAGWASKGIAMFYVYFIQSTASPDQRYVGFTTGSLEIETSEKLISILKLSLYRKIF
jgi:hypothetical protein